MVRYTCPHCRAVHALDRSPADRTFTCPDCGEGGPFPSAVTTAPQSLPRRSQGVQVQLPTLPSDSSGEDDLEEDEDIPRRPSASDTKDILAVVFGSVSLAACVMNVVMCGPGLLLALPLSIAGLVLGLRSQGGKRRLGIILSAVALGVAVLEGAALAALIAWMML